MSSEPSPVVKVFASYIIRIIYKIAPAAGFFVLKSPKFSSKSLKSPNLGGTPHPQGGYWISLVSP